MAQKETTSPLSQRRESHGEGRRRSSNVEVALRWSSDRYSDSIVSFVNGIRTSDGGTHVDGLRAVLTRVVNGQV